MEAPTCDRCGAAITLTGYRATHKDGRELLLCAHHEAEHHDALTKQGWTIEPLTPPEPTAGGRTFFTCPECKQTAAARMVKATPDAPSVRVVYCKQCDSRTCGTEIPGMFGAKGKCDSKALTHNATECPKGHPLMPRDAP